MHASANLMERYDLFNEKNIWSGSMGYYISNPVPVINPGNKMDLPVLESVDQFQAGPYRINGTNLHIHHAHLKCGIPDDVFSKVCRNR